MSPRSADEPLLDAVDARLGGGPEGWGPLADELGVTAEDLDGYGRVRVTVLAARVREDAVGLRPGDLVEAGVTIRDIAGYARVASRIAAADERRRLAAAARGLDEGRGTGRRM